LTPGAVSPHAVLGNVAQRDVAVRFATLPPVLVLASPALGFTLGLLATFLGIGVIANILIAYAVAQVLGERRENADNRDATLDG
jgi:hypothetical protein